MNEADASKHEAFTESRNYDNSPPVEQVSCPFYSVVPNENPAIKQLPLLQPAKEEPQQTQVPESSEHATKQDWVAEPDNEQQTIINTEFQKLLALNEELRSANNSLYEQVEQLKGDLVESEKAVQWQKKRSSVTESMLNQQTQELAAAQEQIQSLYQQLETALQTVQRQESFIETHQAQLQISQQRLAQLERECALLQTNYSEQSQQLSQSETSCRELRTRLMRQQRQTLQFKAALEKCLETPVPNGDAPDDTANYSQNTRQTRFSRKARSLFPNAEPIKPWSADPESSDDVDNSWGQASTPSPFQKSDPVTTPSSPWDWPIRENTSETPDLSDACLEIDDSLTTPTVVSPLESSNMIDDSPIPSTVVPPPGATNIDEQLDSLIQMFFTSQSASSPVTEQGVDSNHDEDALVWETLATTIVDDEGQFSGDIHPPEPSSHTSKEDSTLPRIETTLNPENEDYWLEISQLNQVEFPTIDLPQESFGDDSTDTKSPSPVVYPQRPPKGRKSLASVELPNFRQNSQ
ncbi:MAG: hypothetical protein KME23_20070 [Goleter apudmare HA4340-LM2]|jgi:chemotaxis protein histidine kinase CheA|nr:hypothetical protein [Goleter apudmare HA4340-LM2]